MDKQPPEKRLAVLESIFEQGYSERDAALMHGVNRGSVERWKERHRKGTETIAKLREEGFEPTRPVVLLPKPKRPPAPDRKTVPPLLSEERKCVICDAPISPERLRVGAWATCSPEHAKIHSARKLEKLHKESRRQRAEKKAARGIQIEFGDGDNNSIRVILKCSCGVEAVADVDRTAHFENGVPNLQVIDAQALRYIGAALGYKTTDEMLTDFVTDGQAARDKAALQSAAGCSIPLGDEKYLHRLNNWKWAVEDGPGHRWLAADGKWLDGINGAPRKTHFNHAREAYGSYRRYVLVAEQARTMEEFTRVLKGRFEMHGMATEGRERAAYKAAVKVVGEVAAEIALNVRERP
jgi:transposase-like protein